MIAALRPPASRPRLGETLLSMGVISHRHLGAAMDLQRQHGGLTGDLLIKMGACTPTAVADALAVQEEVPQVLGEILISRGIINQAQLDSAVKAPNDDGSPLGQILINRGLATAEQVASALRQQASQRRNAASTPIPPVGEILVQRGAVSPTDLHDAINIQKTRGGFIGQVLVDMGRTQHNRVAEALQHQESLRSLRTNLPPAPHLGKLLIEREVINQQDLAEALELQRTSGLLMGQALLKLGKVSANAIEEALQEQETLRVTLKSTVVAPVLTPEPDMTIAPKWSKQLARLGHAVPILGLTVLWLYLWPPEGSFNWSVLYKWAWLIPLPFAVCSFIGLIVPVVRQIDPRRVKRPVRRLYLLVVTRGTNVAAAERSYKAMKFLSNDVVRLVFISDNPLPFPHMLVPASFRPKKARFKARALEYFRITAPLEANDWVLHLDEESIIDTYSVKRCLEYARFSPYLWGQGLILYNQHNWWTDPLLAVADSIRVGDDMGRFNLQFEHIHQPIFGAHGSFLLCNGMVENAVTWDHGGITEDFEFAMKAMELGLLCGKVEGVIREQSPESWQDFLKQRRRWFVGVQSINRFWPRVWWTMWALSPLSVIATVWNLLQTAPTPLWLAVGGSLTFSTYAYLYILGALVQDADKRVPLPTRAWHAAQVILIFPLASLLESCAVIWGLINPPKTFEVIKK